MVVASVRRPVVLNTLPQALRHYEDVLRTEVLGTAVDWRHASVEVGSSARGAKAGTLLSILLTYVRLGVSRRTVVVLWPAFGIFDAVVWRLVPGRGRRVIVVHDAAPLRRQFGYGRWAGRLARLALGRRVQLAVHTQLAGDTLRARGIEPAWLAPFPVGRRATSHIARRRSVLVAGQFKDARDTDLMESLGKTLSGAMPLLVRGRGWPEIAGWEVEARFLSEAELNAELQAAGVVLIPYERYFQSDIAVRAVESGAPIAARRHEFMESLLGSDWPGLVDGDGAEAWVDAITAVMGVAIPDGVGRSSEMREGWLQIAGIVGEPVGERL